jgi:hypothetical protein
MRLCCMDRQGNGRKYRLYMHVLLMEIQQEIRSEILQKILLEIHTKLLPDILLEICSYTYSMYMYVFYSEIHEYTCIYSYTNIRPPHHSVGICKYVLEIHAYTAADKAIYCSLEVIYVHIRTYTA